ncbi:MAG: histidinol-phosphatase [Marinifilaceae bacterium]|jgi:histidinol-phosphatase (PHP family)|nr:histidinol-phosphatase [Marinifilaceae bacterium]
MEKFAIHTHTNFCDGKNSILELIEDAKSRNIKELGFTSHAPLIHDQYWSMRYENINQYCDQIRYFQNIEKSLNISLGLEADYAPGLSYSFNHWRVLYDIDYIIGSVHMVKLSDSEFLFIDGSFEEFEKNVNSLLGGDVQALVKLYFGQINEMIINQKPDIVGHIDKVLMNSLKLLNFRNEMWYKKIVDETISILKKSDCIVEVNTRGIYKKKSDFLFPDDYMLSQCISFGIPLCIASDAHTVEEIDMEYSNCLEILKEMGLKKIKFIKDRMLLI